MSAIMLLMSDNLFQSESNEIHKNVNQILNSYETWELGIIVLQSLNVYDEKQKQRHSETELEFIVRIGGKQHTTFVEDLAKKHVPFTTLLTTTKKNCTDKDGKPIDIIKKFINDGYIILKKIKRDERGPPGKFYFRDKKSEETIQTGIRPFRNKRNKIKEVNLLDKKMTNLFNNN
jgi:hypothetical protein